MWDIISYDNEYKRMTSREKRQYNRDNFYKWCEEQFKIVNNHNCGKIIIGISNKEDSECTFENDNDNETDNDNDSENN